MIGTQGSPPKKHPRPPPKGFQTWEKRVPKTWKVNWKREKEKKNEGSPRTFLKKDGGGASYGAQRNEWFKLRGLATTGSK